MSSYIVDSSGRYVIDKDPNAVLDYSIDWDAWVTPLGVNIVSLDVIVNGVTVVASFFNGTVTTAYISGGTVGEKATVTFRITTSGTPARVDDRTIYLKIVER